MSVNELRKFRNILENADYDNIGQDKVDQYSIGGFSGDFETTMKGRADMSNKSNNPRYGDNSMKSDEEPLALEEFDNSSQVDELEKMLRKIGISDQEMIDGVDLTEKGCQKVAAQLGVAAHDVPMLLNTLTTRMRDQEEQENNAASTSESYGHMEDHEDDYYDNGMMTERDRLKKKDRYGYEKDAIGNVTVRDSKTGQEIYLQGSPASNLIHKLSQEPENEQAILASLKPLMEDEIDFFSEMKQKSGTFNFTWKDGKKYGTATAQYDLIDGDLKIKILSVRDADGEPIEIDSTTIKKLEKIAIDYVANEEE